MAGRDLDPSSYGDLSLSFSLGLTASYGRYTGNASVGTNGTSYGFGLTDSSGVSGSSNNKGETEFSVRTPNSGYYGGAGRTYDKNGNIIGYSVFGGARAGKRGVISLAHKEKISISKGLFGYIVDSIAFTASRINNGYYSIDDPSSMDHCFPAHTPITLADNTAKPIETICPGDTILAFDPASHNGRGALVPRRVVQLFSNITQEWIALSNGLTVTSGHRFLTPDGGFAMIEDILVKDGQIVLEDGSVETITGERIIFSEDTAHLFEQGEKQLFATQGSLAVAPQTILGWKTYNFEVEDLHTYVAGGARVHNDSSNTGHMVSAGLGYTFSQGWEYDAFGEFGETYGSVVGNNHATHQTYSGSPASSLAGTSHESQSSSQNGNSSANSAQNNNTGYDGWANDAFGDSFGDYGGYGDQSSGGNSSSGSGGNDSGSYGGGGDSGSTGSSSNSGYGSGDSGGGGWASEAFGDSAYGGGGFGWPVILDLDGDGVELSWLEGSPTYFDQDNDGYLERTAWASSDDGMLVIDLAADGSAGADGVIDQTDELQLANWHAEAGHTDLEGLADAFDSNADGVFDDQDSRFGEFRVWQDLDQDGIADDGELRTLSEAGIASINLASDGIEKSVSGNFIAGHTSYTRTDGTVVDGGVGDVALRYNEDGYRTVETDNGFTIEFENGIEHRYFVAAVGSTGETVDLGAEDYAGAVGGDGDDILTTSGTDDIFAAGGAGNDTLSGGAGNDMLLGGAGADVLDGGDGHDTIFFDAEDGQAVTGGEGFDVAINTTESGVTMNLSNQGFEAAYGHNGDDNFSATGKSAIIVSAGGGDDILSGAQGNDILSGDDGDDDISGNMGDDILLGGAGMDSLSGGLGRDTLAGGAGDGDRLEGGAGDDTYIYNRGDGHDNILDHAEEAYLVREQTEVQVETQVEHKGWWGKGSTWETVFVNEIRTNWSVETSQIDGGKDTLLFGGGIAVTDLFMQMQGNDLVVGIREDGNASDSNLDDTITIENWSEQMNRVETFSFSDGLSVDMSTVTEFTTGTDSADTIDNTQAAGQWIDARGGDDVVTTGEGYDIVLAGDGDDTISTGGDLDQILAGAGDDTVDGGDGRDFISGEFGDDHLTGGAGDDIIAGGDGDDQLFGGEGKDTLFGGAGDDMLQGGAGDDTYLYGRGDGHDSIYDHAVGEYEEQFVVEEQVLTQKTESYRTTSCGWKGCSSSTATRKVDVWVTELRTNWRTVTGQVDGGVDTLLFGGGIGLADLFIEMQGNDLVVGLRDENITELADMSDSVTIENWSNRMNRIETFQFSDGLVVDMSPIDNFVTGTETGDTLISNANGQWVDARGGDDTVTTGDGYDIVQGGDGNDTISTGGDLDQVLAGAGDDVVDGGSGRDFISGESGNDHLTGGTGDDSLSGGDGDDQLFGGAGNDTLFGGAGNDLLYGGAGDDKYIYNRGDGQDTIYDDFRQIEDVQIAQPYQYSYRTGGKWSRTVTETRYTYRTETQLVQHNGGEDTLLLGFLIDIDDLFIETAGEDLIVGLRDVDDSDNAVALSGLDDTISIQSWQNTLNRIEWFEFSDGVVIDMSEITNAVSTHDGDDVLTGTAAHDFLSGGAGEDHLVGAQGNDVLVGGEGDDEIEGGAGRDRLFGGTGNDTLTGSAGEDDLFGGSGDDTLRGGNDKDFLLGNAGDDTLEGGRGDDTLVGGIGNDTLKGGAGDDTYIFNRGDGHDEIDEKVISEHASSEWYTYEVATGKDAVSVGKWSWENSEGVGLSWNQVRFGWRSVYRQTDGGDDTLQFGNNISVNDLFVTMNGDDLVVGLEDLAGAFNEDYYLAENPDVAASVEDGDYISGHHHFLSEGQDAGLSGTDTDTFEDQVTVSDWSNKDSRLEWFRFEGGVALDVSGIEHAQSGSDGHDTITTGSNAGAWLSGRAGNDTITGSRENDILIGGTGDDIINGGSGNDTYIFARGDGYDTYTDSGGSDNLLFGEGITLEDLRIEKIGQDLSISLLKNDIITASVDDKVTISDWHVSSHRLETLQFTDGFDFNLGRLNSFINGGSSIVNTLQGTNSADWVDGNNGDDTIAAYNGNDILFGRGGDDTIDGGSGNDLIFGGAGNDIIADTSGYNYIFAGDGDDTITATSGNGGVIDAGAGDDVISTGSGSENITGGQGYDHITRSRGNDTYTFSVGDGRDYFSGGGTGNGIYTDVVEFKGGIESDRLWFSRLGDDLVVNIVGFEDQMTFDGWFNASSRHGPVEAFVAGQERLTHSNVDQLVSAMASFEPNKGTDAYGITVDRLPEDIQLAVSSAWSQA